MADPKELAARLRKLATGTVEWRVQHPVEKCYCISFDRSDSINPERAAREWLAELRRRHPGGLHTDYEVAEVRCFTELERAALDAAEALDPATPSADAASSDQLIELAGALEQRRGLAIVEDVASLSAGYHEGAFRAGYETACEEITLRLRTEVWDGCLPPVDAPKGPPIFVANGGSEGGQG